MPGVNGYFKLEQDGDDAFVILYPPSDGGKKIDIDELTTYLERNRIANYNLLDIKKGIESQKEKKVFLVTYKMLPSNEEMIVNISEDKMEAIVRFYPPYGGGGQLQMNDIVSTLSHRGVVYGLKKEAIEQFIRERRYCTDYVFAIGKDPQEGTDAYITYFFETERKSKPKLMEDGSVNFHDLDNIAHVNEGDLLARLTREVQGTPGKNVMGNPVSPRQVKKDKLRYGQNIEINEDKTEIRSKVNGHVELADDKVFVSNVYRVPADVDVSTGDIEYEGSIDVVGNVCSGYTLKAQGDIIVGGVVEGATLIAGGDIVLKKGIQGMSKGLLMARGNIMVKFIENASVKSEGTITTESILHSRVTSTEQILITGRKGFVTGGYVAATKLIEAKTIGSQMGAETIISVGTDPDKKEKFTKIQKYISDTQKRLNQIKPMALKASKELAAHAKDLPDDEKKKLQQIMKTYQAKTDEVAHKQKELEELEKYMDGDNNARIRVTDRVFPGTKLVISDCNYYVKDVMHHCQFRLEGADVRMLGL